MDLSGPAAKAEQAFMLAVTPTDPCKKHKMSGRDSEIFAEEVQHDARDDLPSDGNLWGFWHACWGQQGQSI